MTQSTDGQICPGRFLTPRAYQSTGSLNPSSNQMPAWALWSVGSTAANPPDVRADFLRPAAGPEGLLYTGSWKH